MNKNDQVYGNRGNTIKLDASAGQLGSMMTNVRIKTGNFLMTDLDP